MRRDSEPTTRATTTGWGNLAGSPHAALSTSTEGCPTGSGAVDWLGLRRTILANFDWE